MGIRVLYRYRRTPEGCTFGQGPDRAADQGGVSQGARLLPGGALMLIDPCELSPSYVRSIAPYQPGKPISELAREMGMDERKIVKLASNENPFGISPKARAAIKRRLAELARYPDGNAFELKAAL